MFQVHHALNSSFCNNVCETQTREFILWKAESFLYLWYLCTSEHFFLGNIWIYFKYIWAGLSPSQSPSSEYILNLFFLKCRWSYWRCWGGARTFICFVWFCPEKWAVPCVGCDYLISSSSLLKGAFFTHMWRVISEGTVRECSLIFNGWGSSLKRRTQALAWPQSLKSVNVFRGNIGEEDREFRDGLLQHLTRYTEVESFVGCSNQLQETWRGQ